MNIRRKKEYFTRDEEAPLPLTTTVTKRISFSEVDAMGIVWHGRYPQFFELANEQLYRNIGLSYQVFFENDLRAPIVQLHTDYYSPIKLAEIIKVKAALIFTEAARLNVEYFVYNEDSTIAATGYTVQMFTDTEGMPYIVNPPIIEKLKKGWENNEI